MNHAIPGVNAGYISRHKLLDDPLRAQQQAISSTMFGALRDLIGTDHPVRSWLGERATQQAIEAARRETSKELPRCRLENDGLASLDNACRSGLDVE